jgi:hypothetical protein
MRVIIVAAISTCLTLVMAEAHAITAIPTAVTALDVAGSEAVHCTPGKNHHFPTWNFQRDGCRRGSRKNGRPKRPPPAK